MAANSGAGLPRFDRRDEDGVWFDRSIGPWVRSAKIRGLTGVKSLKPVNKAMI
jgi:hypothetical protein